MYATWTVLNLASLQFDTIENVRAALSDDIMVTRNDKRHPCRIHKAGILSALSFSIFFSRMNEKNPFKIQVCAYTIYHSFINFIPISNIFFSSRKIVWFVTDKSYYAAGQKQIDKKRKKNSKCWRISHLWNGIN